MQQLPPIGAEVGAEDTSLPAIGSDVSDLPAIGAEVGGDNSMSPWLVGAGALGVGALGLALHNPALAKTVMNGAMDLRKTSMLSGLAPLKSLLGNVGGAAMGSIERGSMAPIREMLSGETLKDAVQTFKNGPNQAIAGPASNLSKWNIPGRVMGAFDQAGQNALQRAGYSSGDAAREMLQSPLPKSIADKFPQGGVADFLLPFRKTSFNAMNEGWGTLHPQTVGQGAALATSLGTGAAVGAEAEDPKTIAITTAGMGRYGLPHAAAAGVARMLAGGSKTKSTDVMNAVTDFGSAGRGVMDLAEDPLKVIAAKPAAFNAIDYLKSFFGIQ